MVNDPRFQGRRSSQSLKQGAARPARVWLVTGGAGYIGAHVVRVFVDAGESCVVLDDLSTGLRERVPQGVPLYVGDILDERLLVQICTDYAITGVVHLAAKKSAPESIEHPALYEKVNLHGTETLLGVCRRFKIRHFILSSTAAVYGVEGDERPLDEDARARPITPYGQTKLDAELAVEKATTDGAMNAVALRYFNVGGALEAALADTSGENLIPIIRRAQAQHEPVHVFGTQLPTRDGTCVRDYVHVMDIAEAHLKAAEFLCGAPYGDFETVNLGTGQGSTVLEVIAAVERVTGSLIDWVRASPRSGDPIASVCSVAKAERLLDWRAKRSLESIVEI